MSNESPKKTAVDAAQAVSQALRKSLEDIKANLKYTPQETALRVKEELRKHIVGMHEYLVDLQKKEGDLSKAGDVSNPIYSAKGKDMGPGLKGAAGMSSLGHSVRSGTPGSAKEKATTSLNNQLATPKPNLPKSELSSEVSHAEASQPESSADKHAEPDEKKKKKTAAFVPGAGKMAKEEMKAFVPAPGKMAKAIQGMQGDVISSPLAKKSRSVFDILGKGAGMPGPVMPTANPGGMVKATEDELAERSSMVNGTVMPSDKDQKVVDAKKTGSGGKISKGPSMKGKGEKVGEGATWKATKKTEVPSLEDPNKSDDASGGTVKSGGMKKIEVPAVCDPQKKDDGSGGTVKSAKGVKKTEVPTLEDPNKSDDASGGTVKPEVKKGETFKEAKRSMSGDINKEKALGKAMPGMAKPTLPRLGGKDQASKDMTQHAATTAPGYTQGQNSKMPGAQQSMKMPSPDQHSQRANMFADFMPKGFNKADMAKMEEHFAKVKKGKKK